MRLLISIGCFFTVVVVVDGGPLAVTSRAQNDIMLGNCVWVGDRQCPDPDIKFYLFTAKNPNDRQLIYVSDSWEKSNLSASHFDPDNATKVIMHGFNSDMYLTSLIEMKDGEICLIPRFHPQNETTHFISSPFRIPSPRLLQPILHRLQCPGQGSLLRAGCT